MIKLIQALLLVSLAGTGFSLICYSSNGQNRKATYNGMEKICPEVAGATIRYCLKFTTDLRPGKVFRECDHIYEQLFGKDVFTNKDGKCHKYSTKIGMKKESGIYCFCSDDRCNSNEILSSDVAVPENN